MTDNLMLWVDVETTGLDPIYDELLEIGMVLTDTELTVLREQTWLVGLNGYNEVTPSRREEFFTTRDELVVNMHEDSGLLFEWNKGPLLGEDDASRDILEWINDIDFYDLPPMCGSNVPFDRLFLKYELPRVESAFHYRNLDVSSIKNAYRYEKVFRTGDYSTPERLNLEWPDWVAPDQEVKHRPLQDLHTTIQEYAFYREHFFR
jgi:oligoribonuclease